MILDQLVQASQQRVQKVPVRERVKRIQQARKMTTPVLSFEAMLAQPGLQLIGEVKRASPSKGLIAAEFDYLQIAQDYVAAGIDAISVLTEPRYFKGQLSYLQAIAQTVSVPTLRKDFIVAASQIASARIAGASAVLLIVAMHLGSRVAAEVAPTTTALQVLAATFPAGTLAGAPKIEAMTLINHYEQVPRGVYGGCFGYLDCNGNLDMAIGIRLAYRMNERLVIPAGAGIVADSIGAQEFKECQNKQRVIVNAVQDAKGRVKDGIIN